MSFLRSYLGGENNYLRAKIVIRHARPICSLQDLPIFTHIPLAANDFFIRIIIGTASFARLELHVYTRGERLIYRVIRSGKRLDKAHVQRTKGQWNSLMTMVRRFNVCRDPAGKSLRLLPLFLLISFSLHRSAVASSLSLHFFLPIYLSAFRNLLCLAFADEAAFTLIADASAGSLKKLSLSNALLLFAVTPAITANFYRK